MRRRRRKKRSILPLLGAVLLVLATALWTVWGNTALVTEYITVSAPGLPAAFDGLRIVQLSDLHNAEFGEGNVELLEETAGAEPDIIVLTGDLIDSRRTDIGLAVGLARGLAELAPTYFISGNHEGALSWREYARMKDELESAGVIVLEDETVQLERSGETVTLAGLSDPNEVKGEVEARLAELLREREGYTILLAHRPHLFPLYAEAGADLTLSGHAHGGQFRLPLIGGLIAPGQGLFPEYDSGVFEQDGRKMVVSRGLGNSGIPMRFQNRPQVLCITLECER